MKDDLLTGENANVEYKRELPEKSIKYVKSYGLREPEYIDMEVGIRVNFYRPSEENRQGVRQGVTHVSTQANFTDNQEITEAPSNDTVQHITQVITQVTTQVKSLVMSIGCEMMTKDEIVELHKLEHKSNKTLINQYFLPAIQQGYVAMLYPDKPRHPKQKYYLTEKGKELLKTLQSQT